MEFAIRDNKIIAYLLDVAAQPGTVAFGKAKFFSGLGYDPRRWWVLRDHLLRHPREATLISTEQTPYGQKLVYRCFMPPSPNGRPYCIKTVWTQFPDTIYWLSTAYPQNPV